MLVSSSCAAAEASRPGRLRFGYLLGIPGLLVVILLLWQAGPSATLTSIRQAGLGTVVIVLAPAGGMLLHCLGWLALLPSPLRPRLALAFGAHVAAQAGDELGVGIAGEPVKVFAFPKPARLQAAVAVALDNLAQLIGLGCYLLWALPGLRLSAKAARNGTPSLVAALGVGLLGVGLAGLMLLSFRGRHQHRLARGASVERLLLLMREARDAWRSNPRAIAISVFLHLLGKSWIVAEMALVLFLLRIDPWLAFGLAPVSVVASLLGAAIPGQLGAVEVGLAAAGAMAGIEPATIMALALLRRMRTILWVGMGILVVRKVLRHGTDGLEHARSR